jgi:hypothetical protein
MNEQFSSNFTETVPTRGAMLHSDVTKDVQSVLHETTQQDTRAHRSHYKQMTINTCWCDVIIHTVT